MKNYLNIEKSAFRKSEYVGYSCEGKVFRIRKSDISPRVWFAFNRDNPSEQLYAIGLDSMSEKLSTVRFN